MDVAIVGATGGVGRVFLQVFEERDFPFDRLHLVASNRSVGKEIVFKSKNYQVENLETFDFSSVQLAFFSAGGSVSAQYVPKATSGGCLVIDNTSHYRYDADVPLVVPEVNEKDIAHYVRRNIIANPNCSTAQMVVALKPLHDAFSIERLIVSTYQSTSGAGLSAQRELENQIAAITDGKPIPSPQRFLKPIAFNVIPHIDTFLEDSATKEEWKMEQETHKILGASIEVHANCARVPTKVGHGMFVNAQFKKPFEMEEVLALLRNFEGVTVVDDIKKPSYATVLDCEGKDDVFVSRLRRDKTAPNGLSFWCVSDNLRKGAALNAVQIAEVWMKQYRRH